MRGFILYSAMFWMTSGFYYRHTTKTTNIYFINSELIKCHLNSSLVTYSRVTERSGLGCTAACSKTQDCGHVIFCDHSQSCYLEDDNGLYYDWTNFYQCSCYDSREIINVAKGSDCTASSVRSEEYVCDLAVDGKSDSGKPWASNLQGVGAWIKIDLKNTRLLTQARVMQRLHDFERNKEIQLTFSDGSTQMFTLPLHVTPTFIWDDLKLQPVKTSWVNITILSVYTSKHNGWREIELFSPS